MNNLTFTINQDTYTYRLVGQGEVIALFHGFTSTQNTWNKLVAELSEKYQVLTIDLPGHGETRIKQGKTMRHFSDDFKALLDELKINKIHLLGYSMGGRTALSFAHYYPQMIQSLILESASPGIADIDLKRQRQVADKALAENIQTKGIESFVNDWEDLPLFKTQKKLPLPVQNQIRKERLSQSPLGLAKSLIYMGTGTQESLWNELENIDFPLTLIVGSEDIKFIEINKQINELYKAAKLYTIKKAGHCVHLEQEAKFIQVVHKHLQEMS